MSDLKVGSQPAVAAAAIAAADPKSASAHAAQPAAVEGAQPGNAPAATPVVQTTAALDPGEPPIDSKRVATIRRAIVSGHYPLVPARIGDAMIAAGILLRSGG